MSAQQRKRQRSRLEPTHVTAFLTEALLQQGCGSPAVERAQTLWQEFLSRKGTEELTGSVAAWCAALHYLVAPLSGQKLTQKEIGALYQTPPGTLSSRVTLLKAGIDQATLAASLPPAPAKQRKRRAEKTAEQVLGTARKHARPAAPSHLEDSGWVAIFQDTHRLLSHLYGDKTHVEILHYLSHVELNLLLAGHTVPQEFIRDQFGKLFPRLGFQPAKGRDSHKFVSLHDISGAREPFVLLKLGDEDE